MDKQKIKDKIKELEALLEDEPRQDSKKLELNIGSYGFYGYGDVSHSLNSTYRDTFNQFITNQQAQIASKRMSAQNELLQMAFILNGGWKPNWQILGYKYYIVYEHGFKKFITLKRKINSSTSDIFFKEDPLDHFLATASDNLKLYIRGELQ